MSPNDEQLELLISRRLDGALSEAEEAELQGELVRHPAAQKLFDDYKQLDRISAEALQAALGGTDGLLQAPPQPSAAPSAPTRPMYHRAWWAMPAAVAAALVAMVWLGPGRTTQQTVISNPPTRPRINPVVVNGAGSSLANSSVVPALAVESRSIDRDYYWLIGENGRIYLIERQVDRLLERPAQQWNIRTQAGEI